jgi:hypothetical protein
MGVVDAAFVFPNVTVVPETKFVPVIVTCVPEVPEFGDTLLIVGGPEEDEL